MNGLKVEIAWCLDCCVQYHIWQYFLLSCFRLFLSHDCVSHTIFFFFLFFLHFILYKHTEAFRSIFSYLIPSLVMFYLSQGAFSSPSKLPLVRQAQVNFLFHVFLCICDYYLFFYKMLLRSSTLSKVFLIIFFSPLLSIYLSLSLFFALGPVEFILRMSNARFLSFLLLKRLLHFLKLMTFDSCKILKSLKLVLWTLFKRFYVVLT